LDGSLDMLSPPPDVSVVAVGGRQYRKRTVAYSRTVAMTWDTPVAAAAHEGDSTNGDEPGCCPTSLQPQEEMTGKFECPGAFMRFFVGKSGSTKKQLEADTGCRISIPPPGEGSQTVDIRGPTESAVESAMSRLQILAVAARQSLAPTHFISMPLTVGDSAARASFASLCEEVAEIGTSSCAGFASRMVTEPARFHLTLATLKLFTAAEVDSAGAHAVRTRAQVHGSAVGR
jgi:hypothetical protein